MALSPRDRVLAEWVGDRWREYGLSWQLVRSVGSTFALSSGMSHLTAITPIETYAPPVDRSRRNYRHIRVLRWTFRRDEDAVVCELALTGEDREYELRAPADWNPTGLSVERFDDALTAFQRHAMIERTLLDAGWHLDGFESEKVTLH